MNLLVASHIACSLLLCCIRMLHMPVVISFYMTTDRQAGTMTYIGRVYLAFVWCSVLKMGNECDVAHIPLE